MARDPITAPPSNSSGSPRNTSGDRIKSVSGGGANFSKEGNRCGSPPPNNPYGKS